MEDLFAYVNNEILSAPNAYYIEKADKLTLLNSPKHSFGLKTNKKPPDTPG